MLQGIETVKGAWNAKNMCELAVRAAAHARWGDQAGLEAARELARARAAQARDTQRELQKKERALREEELAYRYGALAGRSPGGGSCSGLGLAMPNH